MKRATSLRAILAASSLSLFWLPRINADHPCTAEVASACPDRPASDLATCLQDSSEHDQPTTLSSECTDFVALNKGCAEDIEKFCDDAFFSDDTILCLTQWTEKDNLSPKCASVLAWAVPADEEAPEEEAEVTDELGMSEKDHQEKEEWRAKRKAVREEALERMKMKEADKKKEEDRLALEEFKKNDPEGYAQMIAQQEEEKRQQAAQKKRERQMAAALERKRRQEQGEEEDDAPKQGAQKPKTSKSKKAKSGSWVSTAVSFTIFGLVLAFVYYIVNQGAGKGAGGGGKKASGKKKRG